MVTDVGSDLHWYLDIVVAIRKKIKEYMDGYPSDMATLTRLQNNPHIGVAVHLLIQCPVEL